MIDGNKKPPSMVDAEGFHLALIASARNTPYSSKALANSSHPSIISLAAARIDT